MSLRDCLRYWRPESLTLAMPPQPAKLPALCQVLAQRVGAVQRVAPSPLSLQELYDSIWDCHLQGRPLTSLPIKTLKQAPWVFYYGEQNLADAANFLVQYFQWLESLSPLRQGRVLILLWYVLMQKYPMRSPSFAWLCHRVDSALAASTRIKVQNVYKACQDYALLSADGPDLFASDLLTQGLREACVRRLFSEELFASQFVSHGAECAQSLLSRALASPDNIVLLQNFIAQYEREESVRHLFPKSSTINALLLPFVNKTPTEEIYKGPIRDFLLRHFKDPRVDNRLWHGAATAALAVMERWLVAAQLQDFFSILRDTAEPAWQERQRFWSRYLSLGVIRKAWVILGKEARVAAKQTTLPRNSFADLTGAMANQSVLLMQIDSLIIIEWSHSGACRLCDENDESVPDFYLDGYSGPELRPPSGMAVRHTGNWQLNITQYIYQQTGIR